MKYLYAKNGRKIEADFPIGRAPKTYKGYKRIITIPHFHFKDQNFTRYADPLEGFDPSGQKE
jgi:hypothetical protein